MLNPDSITMPNQIGKYRMRTIIGQGAFSIVRIAVDTDTGEQFACKIVPMARLSTNELQERFEIEIRVLQQMHHPNIVQLIDIIKDDINYYIFMEYCPGGELFQYIVDRKRLPEPEAKVFIHQIVSALKYVHSLKAVHRDLKPENVLLDKKGRVKITDFGFSRYVGQDGLVKTACGSPCYASPEILGGNPYDGSKSDIWSAGVILYACVTGQLPWTKKNQAQLFQQIQRGEYKIPTYLSPECQDIITGMMNVDSNSRLTAQQVLDHPWLVNADDNMEGTKVDSFVSLQMVDKFFSREPSVPVLNRQPIICESARETEIGRAHV